MDLPVSSFVFHSSLLTVKSVDLVVPCDGFFIVMEIVHIFMVAASITEVLFKKLLICTAVLWIEPS